jgi:hypothetical protein
MNLPRSFLLGTSAAILFLCASATRVNAQSSPPKHHGEQTSFSVESDFEHPVPLDEAAKETLANSPSLAEDLKRKHLTPKDLPGRQFTASRIHLGDGIIGLVVMGPPANNAPFWVLRRTGAGYRLVLDTIAAGLDILNTKTNGFRDIEAGSSTSVGSWASYGFQFDGRYYQLTKRISQTTGAKIPADLTGYETHAPFVQHTADDSSTLAQARTWIWRHWKDRRRFYLTVATRDNDDNQATYQLYTSDDSDYPGLVVKIHTSHWEQDSPSEPRRRIIEDDLWIAPDIKRVYPAVDEDHEPQVIPDESDVAASAYQLGFLDFRGVWLATL